MLLNHLHALAGLLKYNPAGHLFIRSGPYSGLKHFLESNFFDVCVLLMDFKEFMVGFRPGFHFLNFIRLDLLQHWAKNSQYLINLLPFLSCYLRYLCDIDFCALLHAFLLLLIINVGH